MPSEQLKFDFAITKIKKTKPQENLKRTKNQEVLQLAQSLLEKHGLRKQGWQFEFDQAKRRAGVCRYGPKIISVSSYYIEKASDPEILDTILHEIAHALSPRRGHDHVWKQVARSIGCNAERCHSLTFSKAKYLQRCENQCFEKPVHRRKKNLICRRCRGKIVYSLNLE